MDLQEFTVIDFEGSGLRVIVDHSVDGSQIDTLEGAKKFEGTRVVFLGKPESLENFKDWVDEKTVDELQEALSISRSTASRIREDLGLKGEYTGDSATTQWRRRKEAEASEGAPE